MNTSKIIKGAVNNGRYTVTAPIVKEDYGLYLQIEGVELPSTYEVDFSNSENSGTSVTMIGNADGVLIPHQFIDSGKDVFAFLYHVGADYGRTVYKFRIPNKVRPDRTNEEPTPEEQSTIDQCISALNEAVAQTAQDVESADQSAQSAQGYAEQAETARDTAQGYANNAQTSANNASASASQASASATASANSASQSAQIKADVESLAEDAQASADASEQSAQASANSATQAYGYAQSALGSAQGASGYASQAQSYAQTASAKAQDASTSAQTASDKATESAQSASQALTYKTDAESAKTASQTAQGLAESARDSAISAKNDAEQAKADAESARDEAQQAVASISGALADKADIITDTASGAIASFPDGADDLPLKSLVVDINPVQDLHGQESPYPAGGGVNKFEPFEGTHDGVTWATQSDGTSKITGTTLTAGWKYLTATYDLPWRGISAGDSVVVYTDVYMILQTWENDTWVTKANPSNRYVIATIPSDVTKIRIIQYAEDHASTVGTSFNIDAHYYIAKGSTFTSWSPYENICPISGWTQVQTNQSGVNVWDEEWEVGTLSNNTGLPYPDNENIRSKNYCPCLPNTDYYFYSGSNKTLRFYWYDADKNIIDNNTVNNAVRTSPSNARYFKVRTTQSYGATYNHDISINYPSNDHDYHPYTGRSITIDLGQTVYGGHIDVLSGELTVYPYYASYNGETLTGEWISDRDKYVSGTTPTIGAQVVNIGAQGVTVQLEPHEVESLYGVNNLWADSGDTEVSYRADTKLYIQKKIAEALASLT